MKISVAKNAGFCFGVKRAISLARKMLEERNKICIMGNIINNPGIVLELESKGARTVSSLSEVGTDETLIIRTHGVKKEILEEAESRGIDFIDAMCKFVKKIHKIVSENDSENEFLLIAGSENHPEVVGIRSYFSKKSYVFGNLGELKKIISDESLSSQKGFIVSQTTFSSVEWEKCVEFVQKSFTNIKIYDTICNVTSLRQQEAKKLSKTNDLVIVIGGHASSNTCKLREICVENSNVIHIEDVSELDGYKVNNFKNIAITAGASTPSEALEEVKFYLQGAAEFF